MTFSPLFAEEMGLPPKPVDLFSIYGFPVNNSMVAAGVATLVIIIVVQIGMRAPKLIPTGLQNFVEWIVELMSDFLESIMGRETMQRGFWFFASLLVFIFAANFLALVPGVGTFGYGHGQGWDFKVTEPFLRGANANDNLTAAYAGIFFVMWFYWCIRQIGVGGVLKDIFGTKVHFPNPILNLTFILIFFFVGVVEVFSIIVVRPIAFTFRLFGNIYGGESFLDTIFRTAPNHFLATLFLIPAYMWEFVVAFVQAFVFFILTAVFTGILTNSSAHVSPTEPKGTH
ncbi:MAG: F0F1 ATP synthase subunit A [Methylacidiphilales bacterium]|nr:F0F1 ATP synthase subunit A [Candidatus Methylacidiphilales bacterium]